MRDPRTEQQLDRGGYRFERTEQFPINKIDLEASATNPARLRRVIEEERCFDMAQAMEAGTDFPAIVLIEDAAEHYIVATGMHRLEACTKLVQPAWTVFDAYIVVEPDSYRRDLLIRSINCIEGRGQTRGENLAHCAELLRNHPEHNAEDIAAAFNLKPQAIRDHLRVLRVDERAAECRVGEIIADPRLFTGAVKRALGTIKIDPLFERTVRVIGATKPRGNVAVRLAQDVAHARSEKAGNKVLDEREEEYASQEQEARRRFGRRKPDIPAKAMEPVKRLVRITNADTPKQLKFDALTATQLDDDLALVRRARAILAAWEREMKDLQKDHARVERIRPIWTPNRTGEPISANISPIT